MTQLFRHTHKILFILPFMLIGCDKPFKEKCDLKCQKCIADCYKECQASFDSCARTVSPGNQGTAENCVYYGNQCIQTCPGKCIPSKEEKASPH